MSDGGWGLADLSALGGWGTFVVTLGGLIHLHGRQTKSGEAAAMAAAEAKEHAIVVAKELADYKLSAAERFITTDRLESLKAEILHRIDKQDEAIHSSFGKVTERLDRIIESRARP